MDEYLPPLPGELFTNPQPTTTTSPEYYIVPSHHYQPANSQNIQHQENQQNMDVADFPDVNIRHIDPYLINSDPANILAYTPLELDLMSRSEADPLADLYNNIDTAQLMFGNQSTTTNSQPRSTTNLVPQPDNLVMINMPVFAGDTAVIETKRYMNLETKLLMTELAQDQAHQMLNHCARKKCPLCWLMVHNLGDHLNRGPFADSHQFSRLDENIKIEILFYATLRFINDDIEGVYDPSVRITPHLNPSLSNEDVEKLLSAAKLVPTNTKAAICNLESVFPCGEHRMCFPTMLALTIHNITTTHTFNTHACKQCSEITDESFLHHNIRKHGRKLLPEVHMLKSGPSLHEIYDFQIKSTYNFSQRPMKKNTLTLNQIQELVTSRSTGIHLVKTNDLFRRLPIKQTSAYIALKELFPDIPPYNKFWCSSDSYPLNMLALMKPITSTPIMTSALDEINRLTENKPPWQATTTFLKSGKFELITLIFLARIRYHFRYAEKIDEVIKYKTGKPRISQLQPTGPATYSDNPNRIKEIDLSHYQAITIGTRLLKKSGLTSMSRHRIANFSPTKKSYLVTASFANFGYFPGYSKQTMVPPESVFIHHVLKIIESTKDIPVIIELDISNNLEDIDHKHWKKFLEEHAEQYILNFCLRIVQIKNQTRIFSPKPREFVIVGQTCLYHPKLTLPTLIEITDKINHSLQIATLVTRLPLVVPAGMVGFTGKISVPLLSVPREAVFNMDGSLSEYTKHQGLRLLLLIIDGLQLLNDVTLDPSFRSHMVN